LLSGKTRRGLELSKGDLDRIEEIVAGAVSMSGPHPEMMPEGQ